MGRDLDCFVHPERISPQLICPICTQVLYRPVQTVSEHLFCEDELLEWMTRSSTCPITKSTLDPNEITRPSRIILNMLAELEVFCSNKQRGCSWIGPQELMDAHTEQCAYRPTNQLLEAIKIKDSKIMELEQRVKVLEERYSSLLLETAVISGELRDSQQRLRLFEALVPTASVPKIETKRAEEVTSDAERLRRLKKSAQAFTYELPPIHAPEAFLAESKTNKK
jgi:hypothetical protein